MNPEETTERQPREIRIEGTGLMIAGGALLALLFGVFYLGIRLGRQTPPESEAPSALSTATAPLETPPPASPAPGYFDRVADAGEPEREVKAPSPTPAREAPAAPKPAPGDYFVQVFAGRDRRAAETLVRSLGERGYAVRLDTQRDGRDSLYKVRVGGYRTPDEARVAAERLKKEGETGAWVTEVH